MRQRNGSNTLTRLGFPGIHVQVQDGIPSLGSTDEVVMLSPPTEELWVN